MNNNIHDIADPQVLAIRTDAHVHDEVKEVKLCECWLFDDRQFYRLYVKRLQCELCEQLLNDHPGFTCAEELKAHKLI